MAAAWDPGIVGGPTNSHISGFVTGKILYRKTENVLCSGADTTIPAPGKGACPIGSLQGCDRKLELQDGILCSWISDLCGSVAWKTGARIFLPFGLIQDLLNKIPFQRRSGHFGR